MSPPTYLKLQYRSFFHILGEIYIYDIGLSPIVVIPIIACRIGTSRQDQKENQKEGKYWFQESTWRLHGRQTCITETARGMNIYQFHVLFLPLNMAPGMPSAVFSHNERILRILAKF
jgi:hypothetical protein